MEAKKSRPVLLNQDGTTIASCKTFYESGNFRVHTIFEARNPVNSYKIEKRLQQMCVEWDVPLGMRLFRDYMGGAKWEDDSAACVFGVYISISYSGYAPYKLNAYN